MSVIDLALSSSVVVLVLVLLVAVSVGRFVLPTLVLVLLFQSS